MRVQCVCTAYVLNWLRKGECLVLWEWHSLDFGQRQQCIIHKYHRRHRTRGTMSHIYLSDLLFLMLVSGPSSIRSWSILYVSFTLTEMPPAMYTTVVSPGSNSQRNVAQYVWLGLLWRSIAASSSIFGTKTQLTRVYIYIMRCVWNVRVCTRRNRSHTHNNKCEHHHIIILKWMDGDSDMRIICGAQSI